MLTLVLIMSVISTGMTTGVVIWFVNRVEH